jgi:nitrate reductase NapD
MNDFNVCSLVVHLSPTRADEAMAAVATLPGVEIHARTEDCRLVVTAVDQPGVRAFDQIAAIHRTPGVVAASLVYHAFDPDSEPSAPSAHDCQH